MTTLKPSSTYRLCSEVKEGVIRLVVSGLTTGYAFHDMNALVRSMGETYATQWVLLDVRDLVVQTSFAAIAGNITAFSRVSGFQEWRTALLCAHEQLSQFDFIEMISQVFGMTLKVFTDEDLAVAWLTSELSTA